MKWTLDHEAKLKSIIDSFIDDEFILNSNYNDRLQVILGESIQAVHFITTLEDEFQFEFNDNEIDIQFFMNYQVALGRIKGHFETEN